MKAKDKVAVRVCTLIMVWQLVYTGMLKVAIISTSTRISGIKAKEDY
jgi:hypothetical protein